MAFPAKNSAYERVCQYLADVGPATAATIKEATGLSYNTVARAFDCGFLTREQGQYCASPYIYNVTPQVRDYLAMGAEAYEGELVKPRSVNMFTKPMTGYTASLTANLREPIREISFFRSSSQCLPRQ